jgi:hypothetical protein
MSGTLAHLPSHHLLTLLALAALIAMVLVLLSGDTRVLALVPA